MMKLIEAFGTTFLVHSWAKWIAVDDNGCVVCSSMEMNYTAAKNHNWLLDSGHYEEIGMIKEGGKDFLIKITEDIVISEIENIENL